MRNRTVLGAIALLVLPAALCAQLDGSIDASASIPSVVGFLTASPLSFGAITPGQPATGTGFIALKRNTGVTFTLPDGPDTGRLFLGGSPSAASLVPTYACGVGATTSDISAPFDSCVAAAGITIGTLAAPGTTVTEYVIFTGTLSATQTDGAPGSYSGIIRIAMAAN